ncbi:Golgi Phosphoprotein 3 [Manis pentadactyla]|nr:Golgi Phosphoprotein 3 [Manis pentadactyla]
MMNAFAIHIKNTKKTAAEILLNHLKALCSIKQHHIKKVQEAVLDKWVNGLHHVDKHLLALIYLAHTLDVLENAFAPLLDEQYDLATKRVRQLLDLDPAVECLKAGTNEVLWAVVAAFTK